MKYANPLKKDRTIASVRGHAVEFPGVKTKDGKPVLTFVHVPDVMRNEVEAAGMQPEEHEDHSEDSGLSTVARPGDADGVKAAVYKVLDGMVAAGNREDFGGNGAPKVAAVNKHLNWTEALTGAELKDLWATYQVDSKD